MGSSPIARSRESALSVRVGTAGTARAVTLGMDLLPLVAVAAALAIGAAIGQTGVGQATVVVDPDSANAAAPLGRSGCRPPSPAWALAGDRRAPEARATARSAQLWALFFLPPRARWAAARTLVVRGLVRREVKIVWRMTGAGPLWITAAGPGGLVLRPKWGPERHSDSTWKRPGAEWGTGFVLPCAGCWRFRVSRASGSGDLWLVAV